MPRPRSRLRCHTTKPAVNESHATMPARSERGGVHGGQRACVATSVGGGGGRGRPNLADVCFGRSTDVDAIHGHRGAWADGAATARRVRRRHARRTDNGGEPRHTAVGAGWRRRGVRKDERQCRR
eukprot:5728409-Prymnesium_polylepis.1